MTYQIAQTARTFALRNTETGQLDFTSFPSKAAVRSWFNLHFGWRSGYQIKN